MPNKEVKTLPIFEKALKLVRGKYLEKDAIVLDCEDMRTEYQYVWDDGDGLSLVVYIDPDSGNEDLMQVLTKDLVDVEKLENMMIVTRALEEEKIDGPRSH